MEYKKEIYCGSCGGFGYKSYFKGVGRIVVQDCDNCKGKGKERFEIIDKRKVSKDSSKPRNLPSEF